MSSIINKVKDAISSDKSNTNTSHNDSTTLNTHNNSTTEPRTGGLHNTSATEPRTGGLHNTSATESRTGGVHSTHGTSANTHDSSYTGTSEYGLGQEANRGVDSPGSKTDGPHKSNLLNKLDPRIDSDGDRSKNLGANKGGDATTTTNTHGSSTTSGTGHTGSHTTTSSSFDPSGSRVATGSDPRIDPEMNYNQQSHGTSGLTGASTTRSGGQFGSGNNIPEGTFGQHNSRLANATDPRVDSDLDSRNTHQTTRTNLPSSTGGVSDSTRHENVPEGTYGQHNSRLANAADPRIDSDHDSRRTHQQSTTSGGAFGTSTTGSHTGLGENQSGFGRDTHDTSFGSSREPGPAPNTAGPHKSDMLNKADPRVDSNMDGSKTYGGNKTYEQGASGSDGRDPRDAAQVPPSVLQQNVGSSNVQYQGQSSERY